MDAFLDTAKRISKPGEQWGALIFHDTGYEQTWSTNYGHPEGIYSKDGTRFTLADPVATDALQSVVDLSTRHEVQPTWDMQREQGAPAMFEAGKIGMLFDRFVLTSRFRNSAQFEWDVAPLPKRMQRRTVNSLQTYALPSGSKNPEGGWGILDFCAGPYAAAVFAKTGYVISPHRKYAEETIKAAAGSSPKAIRLFIEAMGFHTLPTLVRNTEEVRRIYRPKLADAHAGKVTVRDALTSVRPAVEALLKQ